MSIEDLSIILKEKGFKVTPQRLAIYDMLKNTKSHPSIDMIYNSLKDNFPTMSLATVYKTVDMLKKLNLVQELNVGEGSFRYDANVASHPHVICYKCHRVDDLEDANFDDLIEKVNKLTDYDIKNQKLYFYGYCPQCKGKDTAK